MEIIFWVQEKEEKETASVVKSLGHSNPKKIVKLLIFKFINIHLLKIYYVQPAYNVLSIR